MSTRAQHFFPMKTSISRSLLMLALASTFAAAQAAPPADPLRADVTSAQEREL